ncbi:MAG: hypothetical protein V2I36_17080 [Desulfopila sp.]|nr:hypothetical protein [Desulfopila sp.]
MKNIRSETYNGWQIDISTENVLCSNFSFDVTDPSGKRQHVSMGGDTEKRALERARELIDMEIDFAGQNET